jgi:hypothetical protein
MTDAFRATYSDWKVVKGRKVIQVVLELPLEAADQAYQVLGGMPMAANEIWCAVARLDDAEAALIGFGSERRSQPRRARCESPAPV